MARIYPWLQRIRAEPVWDDFDIIYLDIIGSMFTIASVFSVIAIMREWIK